MMVRVQALLSEAFGRQVLLHELFRSSTVQGMASRFAPEELTQSNSLNNARRTGATGGQVGLTGSASSSDENMEVRLTGSTGFLGSAILRHLVADSRVSRIYCVAVRSSDPTRSRSLAVAPDKIVVCRRPDGASSRS